MNRHRTFLRYLTSTALIFCCMLAVARAQPTSREEYREVRAHPLAMPDRCASRIFPDTVINDAASFRSLLYSDECADSLEIDFTKYSLIAISLFVDCNAHVAVKVLRDDSTKVYRCMIEERYGGCRGMTRFVEWLMIEKIPADYRMIFTEVSLEGE